MRNFFYYTPLYFTHRWNTEEHIQSSPSVLLVSNGRLMMRGKMCMLETFKKSVIL